MEYSEQEAQGFLSQSLSSDVGRRQVGLVRATCRDEAILRQEVGYKVGSSQACTCPPRPWRQEVNIDGCEAKPCPEGLLGLSQNPALLGCPVWQRSWAPWHGAGRPRDFSSGESVGQGTCPASPVAHL